MTDTTGKTKDAGWEVGVRTTVPASGPTVWGFLLGDGLPLWLGEIEELPTEKGATYATRDGVTGTIKGYIDGYRIRLSWHPSDWPHDTTLQVTVKASATGTTIAIHQEKLADREERKMMLGHWKSVIEHVSGELGAA
jgi:uncharacterized protein YndB with AHSA1/START domain